jgi:putative endonuclease
MLPGFFRRALFCDKVCRVPHVCRLVYYEQFDDVEAAIRREKRLKKWNRAWKIELIEKSNPNWVDLYPSIASP